MGASMNEENEIFFCELCSDDFSTKKDLYDHLRNHSIEDPFVCSICERKYFDKDLLIGHLGIHSNKQAFICRICKQGFIDKNVLNAHARNHAEREPYICDVYEMEFSKTAAKDDSHICDVYAMEFTDDDDTTGSMSYACNAYEASNMIRHMRFHTREKASVCTICTPNVYDERGAEVRRQSCDVRHRGFSERRSLVPLPVNNVKEEKISVEERSAVLSERQNSDKHLLNRSKRKTPLLCDICRKEFSGKYDLLVHLRTHTEKKDFVCRICKEEFSYKPNLKKHLCQFHPNEIPFVCEICRKNFSDRDRLITHLFTHIEGRAVVCETCKRGTYQKFNRDVHVRKHTRETPFMCDVYERRFFDVEVIRHVRFHPEEKASFCELCKKGFHLEL